MKILAWILVCVAGALTVFTVLPWIRSGWWVVRVCDFPRAQLGAACLLGVVAAVILIAMGHRNTPTVASLILFGVCAAVQAAHVVQFLPIWPDAVPSAGADENSQRVRLLVSNLDYGNEERARVARWLERDDLDLLVLVEVDEGWMRALESVRERYPHRIEAVRPEGLGIALWSKFALEEGRVEHIVSDERPSLHARVVVGDGRSFAINALHPTPPGLKEEDGDREDSRERDAELILLAKRIADEPGTDRLVVGDLNDAAWSHTTRMFLRISGMKDPRRGRGMYSTYPASKPLLRYPIDHVFVSAGYRVHGLRRETAPGSDHLAMFADLSLVEREGVSPEPKPSDAENGEEIIEEGREDARG